VIFSNKTSTISDRIPIFLIVKFFLEPETVVETVVESSGKGSEKSSEKGSEKIIQLSNQTRLYLRHLYSSEFLYVGIV
jgi:hypothetical protein